MQKFLIISVLVLVIFDTFMFFYYKKIVGMFGEFWVKKELKKLSSEYLVFNNVLIKTNDENTHQIDHIIVSNYGIFVVETKQYNGFIIGNEYDKKWIVKAGNKKYYMNNPLRQNYGHIMSLVEILDLPIDKFISLICISSNAKVKVKSDKIVRPYDILSKIYEYKTVIIDDSVGIYEKIKTFNIDGFKEKRRHNSYVKKIKRDKEKKFINICPRCGEKLKYKKNKYSLFMRCSNYSKCKFIKYK